MKILGATVDPKKTVISVILGLAGIVGTLFSFNFEFPPHTVTFIWSLFLPMLAVQAFGWRYALIAVTLGGAVFFPFILWPTNGWVNIICVLLYAGWYIWHGYCADLRQVNARWWNNMYGAQAIYTIVFTAVLLLTFPPTFRLNPPFWYPAAATSMPSEVIAGIAIKDTVMMYLTVFASDLLLNAPLIRRALGLPLSQGMRHYSKVVISSVLFGIVAMTLFFAFERFLFRHELSKDIGQLVAGDIQRLALLIVLLSVVAGFNLARYVGKRVEAEDEIRTSEERFRAVYNSVNDAIFIHDPETGAILDINMKACEMTGYTREEMMRMDIGMLSAGERSIKQKEALDRIVQAAEGRPQLFEWMAKRKDGHLFWVEVNMRLADIGGVDRVLVVVRDITERKRAEEALRESEERFRSLSDSSLEGIMIHDRGEILDANLAFARLFGYGLPEEIIGKNAFELILTPESRARIQQRIERREIGPLEVTCVRKDGSIFTAETDSRRLKYLGHEARLVSFRDITERKHTEEELRESEQRYRTLFESAGDAILLMQGDRFIDCNSRTLEMFGCTREEIIGATPYRFSPAVQPDGRESKEKAFEKIHAAMDGQPQLFEWKHLMRDGTLFDAEVTLNRIELASGLHIQAIVRDVSERKRAEKTLQLQARFQGLLMNISTKYINIPLEAVERSIIASLGEMAEFVGADRAYVFNYDFLEQTTSVVHEWHGEGLEPRFPAFQAISLATVPDWDVERHRRGEAIWIADITALPSGRLKELMQGSGAKTHFSVPLMDQKECIGFVGFTWTKHRHDLADYEQRLLHVFGNMLVNIRLRMRSEEELQVRAQLLDKANDSFFLLDQDGRILYANETACRSRGYSREEMGCLNIRDLLPSDLRTTVAKRISEIFVKGEVVFEGAHIRKDNVVFPVESSVRATEINRQKYLISIVRDITERKQADEALRDSEARFRSLFENAPLAISISRGGTTIYVNQKYLELYGFQTVDELIGRPIFDQWAPESREIVRERAQKRARGEQVPSEYEGMGQRKDGSVFPVHIAVKTITLPDGPAFMAFLWDITERKGAEEEREKLIVEIRQALTDVSRSKKEWQDTFDSITELISIHDREFNIIKANRAVADYFGTDVRHVVAAKCYEIFHCRDAPSPSCPCMMTIKDEQARREDFVDPGTKRTFGVSTFPYTSPDGKSIGAIRIARDITDERDKEMRLIMAERLASLGQMASGIAHEINNPLASISGCAEGLLDDVGRQVYDQARFDRYLKIILEEVARCKVITGSMLSFVRKAAAERKPVDINALLSKTLELIRIQGRLAMVSVAAKYQKDLPNVRGNEGELLQVLLSVVTNALDAMENSGTLTIVTRAEGGAVFAEITDTGPGIAVEHLNRIFDPFFTTRTDRGGTGLGLPIAKKIISNHNGDITVASEPGKGATFRITLPRE